MKPPFRRPFWRQALLVLLAVIAMEVPTVKPGWASLLPSVGNVQANAGYGRVPLVFIPNQGQFDERVAYAIQGRDKSIYFTPEGLTFVIMERVNASPVREKPLLREIKPGAAGPSAQRRRWVVKLDFVGARRDVRPESLSRAETVISFFKGRPDEWKTGLQTSAKIIYRDLWPGIDLIYHGTFSRLKYDFIVHPGADPSQIRLSYRGADSVDVSQEGRLEVSTPLGTFQDEIPVAWQEMDGKKKDVSVAFALLADGGRVAGLSLVSNDAMIQPEIHPQHQGRIYGFTVGDYDRSRILVLDPTVLVYCGFIGGTDTEYGYGIAVDSAGHAYVTGYTDTAKSTFPVTVGPDLTDNGDYDAFVAKVNADGTALVYCGYIGGSSLDYGYGIAVDGSGNAYVVGYTNSPDPPTAAFTGETPLPVVVGPDLTFNGGYDAFVAKVNADGTALIYCGYIGGSNYDSGQGIAVNGSGNAYITGITASKETDSNPFPIVGDLDSTYNGGTYDAFVTKVKADGTGFIYSGYIGGDKDDRGYGIAVDSADCAYVTGTTRIAETLTFPQIVGPDLTHNGGDDVFVAKVNAGGTALLYSGYIGGSGYERGYGIAVDDAGFAYVTGDTTSSQTTFPVAVGPGLELGGNSDAFVAKVRADGTGLVYCGYIGGSGDNDQGAGIAVDSFGNACVTGVTQSDETSFPVIGGPRTTYNGGSWDAFVAKVKADGTGFIYSGYIGGTGDDYGKGIAVDGAGNAYVIGITSSTEGTFQVIGGPQTTYNGGPFDAFVAKIAQTVCNVLKGDLNSDGKITITDAILGLNVISKGNIAGILAKDAAYCMDVNGDGKIGFAEVAYVLQKLTGIR